MNKRTIALVIGVLLAIVCGRFIVTFIGGAMEEVMATYPIRKRPSAFPDFQSFTNLSHSGSASPEAAFETMQFRMHRQGSDPLTIPIQREIWDLPSDFGDPNVRYAINLGLAGGSETGYRIAKSESLATNQVKLTIDYETHRGGTRRQRYTMVQRDGSWRLAVGVTRQ